MKMFSTKRNLFNLRALVIGGNRKMDYVCCSHICIGIIKGFVFLRREFLYDLRASTMFDALCTRAKNKKLQ